MIYEIFDGLKNYVSHNPTVALAFVAVFIALNSLMLARWQRDRAFYENLERTSIFQITENLNDIDRILGQNIGIDTDYSLQNILDGKIKTPKTPELEKQLSVLARYFSEFAGNLDKYSSNIISRKKVCFNFQEYGNKARKYYRLFKHYGYKDIGIEFSILHLKSAGILPEDE